MLLNSEKGRELFSRIPDGEIASEEIRKEDALRYYHVKPSRKPARYEEFWKDYPELGYEGVVRKYAGDRMPDRVKYAIKKRLRRLLVRFGIVAR